jgi:hypothetical protein
VCVRWCVHQHVCGRACNPFYRSARRSVSSGLAVGREPLRGSPCDTLPKLPSVSPAKGLLGSEAHAHLGVHPSTPSHTLPHGFRQSSVAVQALLRTLGDAVLATSIEAPRSMTWRSCRSVLTPMLASAVASSLDDDVLHACCPPWCPQSPRMATVVLSVPWLAMLAQMSRGPWLQVI